MSPGLSRLAERAVTTLAVAVLLLGGFLTGGDVWTIVVEPLYLQIRIVEGLVSVGLFAFAVVASGALLAYDVWAGDDPTTPAENGVPTNGAPVQAIVPAYDDADVVHRSVEALRESAYQSLQIAVVVEPDDEPTRERAAALASAHGDVECVVNAVPGSKATAINTAVERSDADHFVVFDADERPASGFVSSAMAALRGDADVFQGRRVPRPTGPVETLAYCERIVVDTVYAVGDIVGVTHCLSSATGFTREAFESVGGFADVLTEDLHFSHECQEASLTVRRNRRCVSTMEAPHTLRDLWGQRKRWRIGHVQVALLRIRAALAGDGERRGPRGLVTVVSTVAGVLSGTVLLVLAAHLLFLTLITPAAAAGVYTCSLAVITAIWVRDAVDGVAGLPSWTVALAPLVYLGLGVLTVKAVFEYFLTWDGEWYQVTKVGQ